MSQQVMEKVAGSGDELPSEWKWARAFLEDFNETMARFKEALKPADGDELTDFVDELKLNIHGKNGIKALKKSYGNRYEAMLTLFVDRYFSIASTRLGFLSIKSFPYRFLILKGNVSISVFLQIYLEPGTRLNSIAMKVHKMAQASMAPTEPASKRKGRKSG